MGDDMDGGKMSTEAFVRHTEGGVLSFGRARLRSDEIGFMADAIRVGRLAESSPVIRYENLVVHSCSDERLAEGFSDWLSDFLTNPILAFFGFLGIGQEQRSIRVEFWDRVVGRPIVTYINVPDSVPEEQVKLLCPLIRALSAQPELAAGLEHPTALEMLLTQNAPDQQQVAQILRRLTQMGGETSPPEAN